MTDEQGLSRFEKSRITKVEVQLKPELDFTFYFEHSGTEPFDKTEFLLDSETYERLDMIEKRFNRFLELAGDLGDYDTFQFVPKEEETYLGRLAQRIKDAEKDTYPRQFEASIDAGCRVEASWDGRNFDSMGNVEKKRYRDRLWAAIQAFRVAREGRPPVSEEK